MQFPNWFEPYAQPMFEKHLTPLAGKSGLRFLQVGAFTGDASLWMLRNVLTGAGSTLTDVDTWQGSDEPEHRVFDWAEVERAYDERMRGFASRGRLNKFKGTSAEFFNTADGRYDFIYIDGDHFSGTVFSDGGQAVRLLNPGGLLAFDDYQWKPHGGGDGPGAAVDKVCIVFPHLTTLEVDAQAWFQA